MGKKSKYGSKVVKYAKDYMAEMNEEKDWVILPKWAHESVVCSHTKRYHNCLYLLAGLGSCARDLMDFITEEMDNENVIYTNAHFRNKFSSFIDKNTQGATTYSDSSVKRALSILFEKNLLRPMRRGYSMVNPKFFFRNDDSKRLDKVRLELEFENGSNTKLKALQEKYKIETVE